MVVNAFAAEALGDIVSYNKLRKIVNDEYNQWKSNAEHQCKQKSHTGWLLGGGETYYVNYDNPFEENSNYKHLFSGQSADAIHRLLAELQQNNWMVLYSPI